MTRDALAEVALAGGAIPTVPGTVIIDPDNPSRAGFYWVEQVGLTGAPLSWAALGGGGVAAKPATGGLTVVPDPELASIRANCWWSGAPYIVLTRIVDGVRSPVRGGFPATVTTPTRRNRWYNPGGEVSTAGYSPGTNTTVGNPTDEMAPSGTRIVRATRTGSTGTVTVALPVTPAIDQVTGISWSMRLSSAPAGALTVTGSWADWQGTALSATTTTIPAGSLTGFVGQFARVPTQIINPPLAASVGTLTLTVAGLPVNGTVDLDAGLAEYGEHATLGNPFDGDTLTGAWTGTAGLSSSTLASTMVLADNEAPLDVPIRYELSAPSQPGYRALSEPVVLDSKRRTWLSHPEKPTPLSVWVTREPEQTHGIEQQVFRVVGRPRPIVVSSERQAVSGSLQLFTDRFFERDRLRAMLADGSVLLLRAPAALGHGPGEWIAIGDVSEKSVYGDALDGPRYFEFPYQVVDAPALQT